MPPKRAKVEVSRETSSETAQRLSDPDLLEKILQVLDDFDETIGLDPESMVSVKPAFKAAGNQLGIKFRGTWSNHSGKSTLEAILTYHAEITE